MNKPQNTTAQIGELVHKATVKTDAEASNLAQAARRMRGMPDDGVLPKNGAIENTIVPSRKEQLLRNEQSATSPNVKTDKTEGDDDEIKGKTAKSDDGKEKKSDKSADDDDAGKGKEGEEKADKTGDDAADPDAEESADDRGVSLAELAKQLEVEVGDLYAVEIPLGKDKSITLGEMKDLHNKWAAKAERFEQVETRERQLQGEVIRTQQTVADIVATLPPHVLTPAYLQKVDEFQRARNSNEMSKFLTVRPDLADPIKAAALKKNIASTVLAYGLTEADVDNIADHRWLLALTDLSKLQGDFSRASSEAKNKKVVNAARPAQKQSVQAAKSALAQKIRERAKKGDRDAQSQLIGELLLTTPNR